MKCPACRKGILRLESVSTIECSECSVLFEVVGNGVRCIPAASPREAVTNLAPEVRHGLFFDRLVLGESPQQVADALRKENVIISPSTIQNYKENHAEEISRRRGQLASSNVRKGE